MTAVKGEIQIISVPCVFTDHGGRDGRVLSSRTVNALPPVSGVQLIKLSAAARTETFSVDGRRL